MSRCCELRAELPGTLEAVDAFCQQFRSWYATAGDRDSRFGVELLLREALTNGVKYGSGSGTPVTCVLRGGRRRLLIAVMDQGQGFDWRAVLNRTPVEITSTGGRGLEIYRRYADRVRFNSQGNSVVLIKRFLASAVLKEEAR
ncbi:MAG: ATP-binding protein [Acidobacteria bacterium]|nr:ATP-binding protein [Acidobacteriota bacterium]